MPRRLIVIELLESRRHLDAIPYHLQLAEQLVSNITPANNIYAHGTPVLNWAGMNGATVYSNSSDCSSFDTALLTAAYHFTAKQFSTWTGSTTPQAKDFYNAAIADNGFTGFSNVASVQPGDDMFMKYLDSTTDTGHVLTIDSVPTLVSTTATQRAYNITVIDSTGSPHTSDTRTATGDTGVGEGVMRIYTDLSGNLTSYSWGTSAASVIQTAATRPATFAKIPNVSLPTAPLAPSGLVASAVAGGTAQLTWKDNATNETGYTVQRSVAGSPFVSVATLSAGTTTWSDSALVTGQKYLYRVRAYNDVGTSDWSTSLTILAVGVQPAKQLLLTNMLGF